MNQSVQTFWTWLDFIYKTLCFLYSFIQFALLVKLCWFEYCAVPLTFSFLFKFMLLMQFLSMKLWFLIEKLVNYSTFHIYLYQFVPAWITNATVIFYLFHSHGWLLLISLIYTVCVPVNIWFLIDLDDFSIRIHFIYSFVLPSLYLSYEISFFFVVRLLRIDKTLVTRTPLCDYRANIIACCAY